MFSKCLGMARCWTYLDLTSGGVHNDLAIWRWLSGEW